MYKIGLIPRRLRRGGFINDLIKIVSTSYAAFSECVFLILQDPKISDLTWANAQNVELPDVSSAQQFLNLYQTLTIDGQDAWNKFRGLQKQIDETVANWYGFSQTMKDEIAVGLPWARRKRPTVQPVRLIAPAGNTIRQPVTSSFIAAIGYDVTAKILEVEKKDKIVLQYSQVPDAVYQGLLAANSYGNYYNTRIRNRFNSQIL